MFQKQLRKDFARAISKATLVLMLPLTLAATALPASAQESSPAAAPPVTEQAAVQDTLFIKEGETLSVLPETEIPLDTLEKRYPFLRDVLTDVREYNEEFKDNPTRVLISNLRDAEEDIDLVFISVQGPMTCGASQCQMNIFMRTDEGYRQISAGAAPLPAIIHKDNGEISLYFCSKEGRSQFVLSNGTLEHKGNVVSPQAGPACPHN